MLSTRAEVVKFAKVSSGILQASSFSAVPEMPFQGFGIRIAAIRLGGIQLDFRGWFADRRR